MGERSLVSFDWAMKKLLRSKANFEILEGFLTELLAQDITILEVLESESNRETVDGKLNQIDVKVKNDRGEIIIVEVQYERESDFIHRSLYGNSKVIVEHLAKGAEYEDVVKVYSISILYFDIGQGKDYMYHGRTVFHGRHLHDVLALSPRQQKVYGKEFPDHLFPEYYLLKINNFNDVAKTSLDEWIYFLKNAEIKSSFSAKGLQKAQEELDIINLSKEDRLSYEIYQKNLHYEASMIHSTLADGIDIGRELGIKIGKEQVIEEGKTAERKTLAREMLNDGEPLEKILKYTHLSKDDVEKMRS